MNPSLAFVLGVSGTIAVVFTLTGLGVLEDISLVDGLKPLTLVDSAHGHQPTVPDQPGTQQYMSTGKASTNQPSRGADNAGAAPQRGGHSHGNRTDVSKPKSHAGPDSSLRGLPRPSQVTVGSYDIPRISSAIYDRMNEVARKRHFDFSNFWMLKGEMFVHQRLQSWEGYSQQLLSASLKYVPYYEAAQVQSRTGRMSKEGRFTEWAGVESIITSLPTFQARHGTDHIYFFSHDYGGCMMYRRWRQQTVPTWVRRGIIASTLGDKRMSSCFRKGEDIVAPPALKLTMVTRALKWLRIRFPRTLAAIARARPRRGASRVNNRLTDAGVARLTFPERYPRALQQEAADDDKRRRRLAVFRGQEWHSVNNIRKRVAKLLLEEPRLTVPTVGQSKARRSTRPKSSAALRPGEEDVPIPLVFFAPVVRPAKPFPSTRKLSEEDTAVDMLYTHFCLCPAGYAPWSPRPFLAMLAGCIPVLLSDDIIMPFGEILDWDELSVRIPEAKVNSMYSILSSIPAARRQRLRLNILHAAPYVMLLERRLNETEAPGWGREDAFDLVMHLYVQRWLRRCRKNVTACVG